VSVWSCVGDSFFIERGLPYPLSSRAERSGVEGALVSSMSPSLRGSKIRVQRLSNHLSTTSPDIGISRRENCGSFVSSRILPLIAPLLVLQRRIAPRFGNGPLGIRAADRGSGRVPNPHAGCPILGERSESRVGLNVCAERDPKWKMGMIRIWNPSCIVLPKWERTKWATPPGWKAGSPILDYVLTDICGTGPGGFCIP
jgi:hypothetical protein